MVYLLFKPFPDAEIIYLDELNIRKAEHQKHKGSGEVTSDWTTLKDAGVGEKL